MKIPSPGLIPEFEDPRNDSDKKFSLELSDEFLSISSIFDPVLKAEVPIRNKGCLE